MKLKICTAALMLSACGDMAPQTSETSAIIETPYIIEAQKAGVKKFGPELLFTQMYENNDAVCGDVKKGEGAPQQFIYVRSTFLLQGISPSGEWEAQWFTECDDG